MTEEDIQYGLWIHLWRKGHSFITPNAHLLSTGEMDMCSIMKSGKVCEYEIKISRSDFKADFKKDKHRLIGLRLQGVTEERIVNRWGVDFGAKRIATPNHFSYVVPENLVAIEEVPAWAGLIYVSPRNVYSLSVVKRALQIHPDIDDSIPKQLGHKLMHRFWDLKSSIRHAPTPICQNCLEKAEKNAWK
jgi:hypothetical protein